MKLLILLHSLSPGGAERITATLANYWASRDWHVTIVTVTGRERDFYSLNTNIQRIALHLDVHSHSAAQAVFNNLRRVRAVRNVLRREKPDVAFSMMATANVTLALASWCLGVPTIGSERTYPPALPLGRLWESLRRLSYPRLSALVAQTAQSAEWLQVHAPAPTIQVIPNPVKFPMDVQAPRLPPAQALKAFKHPRVLLAVGRLGEEKRFDHLLRAFARLLPDHPEWVLVILGEGKLRDELEREAERRDINDRVCMPGAVGNVGEWFGAADLYVLTSRFEGFPNTLLEALAHGVPAVAVDCKTGPREIIHHEVDGLLVPQDNQDALLAALDRMMANGPLRAQFAERAVKARERFALERIADQWEQLFKECIDVKRQ